MFKKEEMLNRREQVNMRQMDVLCTYDDLLKLGIRIEHG